MNKTYIIALAVLGLVGISLYTISERRASIEDAQANVAGFETTSSLGSANNSANNSNTNMDPNSPNQSTGAPTTPNNLVAQNGDLVAVQYTGKLTDGKVFDSSIPRGEPFVFQLGAGMVIAGWDKGLVGMKVGEKKTLTIKPEDGYGAQGVKDPQTGAVVIPGNATLIFDVEVVDIKRQ